MATLDRGTEALGKDIPRYVGCPFGPFNNCYAQWNGSGGTAPEILLRLRFFESHFKSRGLPRGVKPSEEHCDPQTIQKNDSYSDTARWLISDPLGFEDPARRLGQG